LILTCEMPVIDGDASFEDAQRILFEARVWDGLPLVPPTRGRLQAMLATVNEPQRVLGAVPPLMGRLTPAAAAYFAVVAGCQPRELAVVIAAARAALNPQVNLLGVQSTTGSAALAVIVHGPIVLALGMNFGANSLGPGNRVNATVGRAVAMVLRGLGGAWSGLVDMATIGQPGKFTMCIAESPEGVFPGLMLRRTPVGPSNAVTVVGVRGHIEVIPLGAGDSAERVLDPVARAMALAAFASGGATQRAHSEHLLLLPPEVAANLARWNYPLSAVQQYLFKRGSGLLQQQSDQENPPTTVDGDVQVAHSHAEIYPVITGGVGVKMAYLPCWGNSRLATMPIVCL
jgi:hypothetical protein